MTTAVERPGSAPADPVARLWEEARKNLAWLRENVPSVVAGTLRHDEEAIASLATGLSRLRRDRQVVVADREHELIIARLDVPGSIFDTVQRLHDRDIPYAEISHSREVIPGTGRRLEIQRYRFDRRSDALVAQAGDPGVPAPVRRRLREAFTEKYGDRDVAQRDNLLRILWINDPRFVELANPREVVRFMWLLHRCRTDSGFVLEVEDVEPASGAPGEANVLFAVESPPSRGFLAQVMEVFNVLDLGVRDSLTATISTGTGPCFIGTFRVAHRRKTTLENGAEIVKRLRRQIYSTQILGTETPAYREHAVLVSLDPRPVVLGEGGIEGVVLDAFVRGCEEKKLDLVLDLRHNQGGYLSNATSLVAALLPSGQLAPAGALLLRATEQSRQVFAARAPGVTDGLDPQRVLQAIAAAQRTGRAFTPAFSEPPVRASAAVGGYGGRVVALVSPSCTSACDRAVAMLRGAGRALVVGGPSEGAGGSMQESPGVGARWQDSQGLVWLKIPNAAMGVERAVAGAERARELTADEFFGGLAFENRPVEPDLPYATRLGDVTGENRGWLALVERSSSRGTRRASRRRPARRARPRRTRATAEIAAEPRIDVARPQQGDRPQRRRHALPRARRPAILKRLIWSKGSRPMDTRRRFAAIPDGDPSGTMPRWTGSRLVQFGPPLPGSHAAHGRFLGALCRGHRRRTAVRAILLAMVRGDVRQRGTATPIGDVA